MKKMVVFGALIFLLAACGDKKPLPNEIVAKIGEAYLTRDVVMQMLPENLNSEERDYFIKRIVEQWLDNQALAVAATDAGLLLNQRDQFYLQNLAAEMQANYLLENKIRNDFNVTDSEVEDYYAANPEQFKRDNDEVHLIHLFFEKPDRSIVREIRKSKNLMEVIKSNYLDLQVNHAVEPNGDLGYVALAQLRPEYRKAIRGKKTGIIYGPVRTKQGIHYLQVIDRQPTGSIRKISLVRNEIVTLLSAAKRERRIKKYKETMRKQYHAETFYQNIL